MALLKLRPEVKKFANEMERVLRENDHKGGWQKMTQNQLLGRILDEYNELRDCQVEQRILIQPGAQKECVDIANFCMMLFDNLNNYRN